MGSTEVAHYKQELRSAALRATSGRLAVLQALESAPHSSAEQVFALISDDLPGTSPQAVYMVLNDLARAGLIRRFERCVGRRALRSRPSPVVDPRQRSRLCGPRSRGHVLGPVHTLSGIRRYDGAGPTSSCRITGAAQRLSSSRLRLAIGGFTNTYLVVASPMTNAPINPIR